MSDIVQQLRELLGPAGVLSGEDVSNRMIHVWRQEPIVAKCIPKHLCPPAP